MADTLNILTYNVFMRPIEVALISNDKLRQRAKYLVGYLQKYKYDAVILNEVFVEAIEEYIIEQLQDTYPYHTNMLGQSKGPIKQNGGVMILSRYELDAAAESQRAFGDVCEGNDCLADKGALYAKTIKNGKPYNIIGTHANAEPYNREIRAQQFAIIRTFIGELEIPQNEPLIIGGDMNVDKIGSPDEYAAMLDILGAAMPASEGSNIYTYEPATNEYLDENGAEGPQLLDYVLYSTDHLQPVNAYNKVRKPKFRNGDVQEDVSDHYPVQAEFTFEFPAVNKEELPA